MEQSGGQICAERAKPPDGGGECEDRLSALPDDVLVLILLGLDTTAEAARTSVLARRWRRLSALLPELRFDRRPDGNRIRELLDVPDAPELRYISVTTKGAAADSASAWLPAAARRLAGGLSYHNRAPDRVNLVDEDSWGGNVQLPCFENATTIELALRCLGLTFESLGVFSRLTALSLKYVEFRGTCDLGNVVSSPRCPCLQKLRIWFAWGLCNLSIYSESLLQMELRRSNFGRLTIETPNLQKLSLKFNYLADHPSEQTVNITAPQIVSLVWMDSYDPRYFHLGNLGQLRELEPKRIVVYGEQSRENNHDSIRLLQQFQALYCLRLLLVYHQDICHYQYLLGDIITLPQITLLHLDLTSHGHAFGAGLFHLLGKCIGLRRLSLVLDADSNLATTPGVARGVTIISHLSQMRTLNWRRLGVDVEADLDSRLTAADFLSVDTGPRTRNMPPPPAPTAPARAMAPTFLPFPHRYTRRRRVASSAITSASTVSTASRSSHASDAVLLRRAADVADRSAGLTSPHPNFGCVIARPQVETETETGRADDSFSWVVVGEGFLYAQGMPCAELLAAREAGAHARGATAFLNLEPGDCSGDSTAVRSLVQAGIKRVVVGLRNPLKHLRGKAIQELRSQGIRVDVVGEDLQSKVFEEALNSCLTVNAPLLYRAAYHVPFSILKYAMTADGKIASSSGHASWISSKASRGHVFELCGRSDVVIVGGNTMRFDDPRLTARHVKGHAPVRIVMSQSLNLPEEANLWNLNDAYTIVATQKGARRDFQKKLAMKGVEVVEFDMLNPSVVMSYCFDRGYLSVLWECGGTLAASAISANVIHKVYAFWAPKIIGGLNAPTPVGELGMSQMTQAINLIDVSYEQIGRDILMSGFIKPIPNLSPVIPSADEIPYVDPEVSPYEANIISFYNTWDSFGAFSNFSPHPIDMPDENGDYFTWPTVEHYYQAQKFIGVDNNPQSGDIVQEIKLARSPEEAFRIGKTRQKKFPKLVRTNWQSTKIDVMYKAIKCKFSTYPHLTNLLLSTAGSVLVEVSPNDLFWGGGWEGEGLNHLGRLLMQLRSEILGTTSARIEAEKVEAEAA